MTIWNDIQRELERTTPAAPSAPRAASSVWDDIEEELSAPPVTMRPQADAAGMAADPLEMAARQAAKLPEPKDFTAGPLPTPSAPPTVAGMLQSARDLPLTAGRELVRGFGAGTAGAVQDTTAALASRTFPVAAPQIQGANVASQQALAPVADSYADPRKLAHTIGQVGGSIALLAGAGGPARQVGGAVTGALAKTALPPLAARAAGTLAGSTALAAPEALQEAASVWNTVLRQTGDQRAADAAALKVATGNAALLMVTNVPLLERVRGMAGVLARSASEGGQEAAQQAMSNVATGRPTTEGLLEAATIGAVAAPVAGGIVDATQRLRQPAPVPRPVPAAEAPPLPRAAPTVSAPVVAAKPPVVEQPSNTAPTAAPIDTRVRAVVRELNLSEDEAVRLIEEMDREVARPSQAQLPPPARVSAPPVAPTPPPMVDADGSGVPGFVPQDPSRPDELRPRLGDAVSGAPFGVGQVVEMDDQGRVLVRTKRGTSWHPAARVRVQHRPNLTPTMIGIANGAAHRPPPAQTSAPEPSLPVVSSPQGAPGVQEAPVVAAGPAVATSDAVQAPTPAVPKPKARLRELLPDLGFTAKGDHATIYRDLYRDAERQAKRVPTPADMLAVVDAWAEHTRRLQSAGQPGDRKATLAVIGRALREGSQAPVALTTPAPQRKPTVARPIAEDAVANGYPGTVEEAEDDIVSRARELYDAVHEQDAQTSGRALLRAIVERGGIDLQGDKATPGEAKWLGEFRDIGRVNTIAGVRDVFRRTTRMRGEGTRVTGQTFDDMATGLRAEGWPFENGDQLLEAIAQVKRDFDATPDTANDFDIPYYAQGTGIAPGTRWWEDAPAVAQDDDLPDWAIDDDVVETDEPGVYGEGAAGTGRVARGTPSGKPRFGDFLERRQGMGDFERQGSPTRRPFFDAPSPEMQARYQREKPISEQQAVEQLRDIFAEEADTGSVLGLKRIPLPTRMGKVMRGAFGHYEPGPRLIRLKRSFDLATFTHELGHHLDMAVFERTSRPAGLFKQELLDLGKATSSAKAKPSYQLKEGVAEYFRIWMVDPAQAQAKAPHFTAALGDVMAGDGTLQKQLAVGQQVVQRFVSQSLAQRGASRISVTPEEATPTVRERAERAYTKVIDDLAPIRRAVADMAVESGKMPRVSADAYVLARNAAGHTAKAQGFTRVGVRGKGGRFLSGSLEEALAPVRERLYPDQKGRDSAPDFASYLVALRAKEVRATGRDAGMTIPEANALLARVDGDPIKPAFEAARDKVYAYQRALLEYAKQYGAFNDGQLALITQFAENYVPLQRVITKASDATSSASKLANLDSPVKRLKGSGRDIIDPIESIVKNTAAIVDMVEKNNAMRALAAQAKAAPGAGKWLVPVSPKQVATSFSLAKLSKDLREVLDDAGLKVETLMSNTGPTLEVEGRALDLDELVTIFQPAQVGSPKDRIVTVIDKGERKFYQVQDEALYEAITHIGVRPSSELLHWVEKPVQWLRAGVILAPAFAIRNVMRDTVGAMIQSRHGFIPVWDSVRGATSMIRKDADYQRFMTSGVQSAVKVDIKRQRLRDEVDRLTRTPGAGRATVRLVRHPIEALRAFSELFEVATRLGEYKLAIESRGAERRAGVLGIAQRLQGKTSTPPLVRNEDVLTKAALDAADVTVDFRRGGQFSKEISRYSAFFNARVQGFSRIPETVRRDPTGVALTMGAMSAVTAALWSLNNDDEQYQELNPQVKRDYWVLRATDDAWVFIPKPHEWAMVPNLVEGYLEWAKREDNAGLKALLPDVGGEVLRTLVGTGILPWLEAALNRDLYRGRPIVAPWKEKLDPELQDNEWTTDAARLGGRVFGLSPAKVEHVARGMGGTLASEALQAADLFATPLSNPDRASRASKRVEQLPVVGGLLRDPSASSRSASLVAWRERWDDYEQAKQSVAELAARGDVDRAKARVSQALDDLGIPASERPAIERASARSSRRSTRDLAVALRIPRFEAVRESLSGLNRKRAEIEGSRTLSPDEKRAQVDAVMAEQVKVARSAMGRQGAPSLEALGLKVKR